MSSPIDNYRNYLARNYSDMKLPAGKPYGVIKLAKGYDFGFHVRKDHVSVHFISNGTHDPEEVMGYINDNGIGDKTYGDGLAPDVSRGKRNAAVVRCEVHIPLESVEELRKPTLRKHSQQIFGELYDDFSGIVEGSEIETQDNRDEEKNTESKGVSETTLIKIEIYFEEHMRVVNGLDISLDKKIDISNFNSDSYFDIISDEDFLKKTKASIERADDWRYDLYQTDLEMMGQDYYDDLDKDMSLDYIKNCMEAGDYLNIRIVGVGDKDLSFLSISKEYDEKNESHENFLKGTNFEAKLTDGDFEDSYNECIGSNNLLAFDYVLNYEGSDKTEEVAEIKPESDDEAEVYETAGSDLTDEQIKEFKEQEKEAEDTWTYVSLAAEIAEAGDKDWARKLYQKAEDLAEDSSDYNYIADSVADEDNLGEKDWARTLYKKAEDLAEDSSDYSGLADSVADEDYLGDKKYAKELYKKAEDLAEDSSDYSDLADSVADEDYLGDKDWARKLYKKAEDLAEDPSDYSGLAVSVADEDYLGDKKWARELYDKALDSDGSFDDFKKLCTDYLDDKSIFDEEYFEKAFEKALGLKSSADEYDIDSFADSLKEAGETDKLEKLKEPLNIEIGITHNIEINGDSIFRCSFDIDFNYYEEQTGDESSERFEFDYDFKKGVIVNYNYNNAELDFVRIPNEDQAEIWSCWYLGQSGDYMNDDFIHMHGDEISDVEGEHAAEMEEIVKTINPKVFKELASAALNRIKGLEGIN